MISVIILTKNEERNLSACLKSLEWSDDIHVLASGSVDKTIDIAGKYGANVWSNPFESFGKQRNFALDNLNIRHDWVLFVDADEIVTETSRRIILEATKKAGVEVAGFYCCWK